MATILNKRRSIMLLIIASILVLPVIGMQLTNEVNWSFFDFLIAFLLLASIGFGIDLAMTYLKTNVQRFVAISIILIIGFLIWAEMALGIFGSPFAGS